jgi:lipid A 3-O-deacylase
MFEHLSHGQILGKGRNQGIDNVGVRVIYRLGE